MMALRKKFGRGLRCLGFLSADELLTYYIPYRVSFC